MKTESITLAEALPKEIERCQEVLQNYLSIGPAGAFGAAFIEDDINQAKQAILFGDTVGMLRSYQKLKEIES